jgi:hypothetical protein
MITIHGSNLPLLKVLTVPFATLHEALTPCEDDWTLSTVKGEIYEDVVLMELTRDKVTIQHVYGVDTIARADLDRESQQWLIDHSMMAEPDDISTDDHFAHARPMTRASFSHAA